MKHEFPAFNIRKLWKIGVSAAVICATVAGISIYACAARQPGMTQAAMQAQIDAAVPGIICWGDSITQGEAWNGGLGYPEMLETIIDQQVIEPLRQQTGYKGLHGPQVLNMGVSTETSLEIAGRDGAIPFLVNADFVIPAGTEPVAVSFCSAERGAVTKPLRVGDAGVNDVTIAGVTGKLLRYFDTAADTSRYQFRRNTPGAAVIVRAGEPIYTYAATHYGNYIMIILMGVNGDYTDINDLILQYQMMINPQTQEHDRYIAAELPRAFENGYDTNMHRILSEEAAMQAYFGEHYISVRQFLNQNGLAMLGLTPTAEDTQRIATGQIPSSIMKEDKVHLLQTGYYEMAVMFYGKMDSLGYFDGIKALRTN